MSDENAVATIEWEKISPLKIKYTEENYKALCDYFGKLRIFQTRVMCENLIERIVTDFKQANRIYCDIIQSNREPVNKLTAYVCLFRSLMLMYTMSKSAGDFMYLDGRVRVAIKKQKEKEGKISRRFRVPKRPLKRAVEVNNVIAVRPFTIHAVFQNKTFKSWVEQYDPASAVFLDRFNVLEYQILSNKTTQKDVKNALALILQNVGNVVCKKSSSSGWVSFVPLLYCVGTALTLESEFPIRVNVSPSMKISYKRTTDANTLLRRAVISMGLLKVLDFGLSEEIKMAYQCDVALAFASVQGIGHCPIIFSRGCKSMGGVGFSFASLYICDYEKSGTKITFAEAYYSRSVAATKLLATRDSANTKDSEETVIDGKIVKDEEGKDIITTDKDVIKKYEDSAAEKLAKSTEAVDEVVTEQEEASTSESGDPTDQVKEPGDDDIEEDQFIKSEEAEALDKEEEALDNEFDSDLTEEEKAEDLEADKNEIEEDEAEECAEEYASQLFATKKDAWYKRLINSIINNVLCDYNEEDLDDNIDPYKVAEQEEFLTVDTEREDREYTEYADGIGNPYSVGLFNLTLSEKYQVRYFASRRLTVMGYNWFDRYKIWNIELLVAKKLMPENTLEQFKWIHNRICGRNPIVWCNQYSDDILFMFNRYQGEEKANKEKKADKESR